MRLQRVLIAWELGGQLGHLARLLPIARYLRDSGVRVMFAVRHLEQTVALLGADSGWVIVQAPAAPKMAASSRGAVNHADLLLLDGFASMQSVVARVTAWCGLFSLFKPDVVLSDFSPMSVYAARIAGIPVLRLGHGFEIPPAGHQALPAFRPWQKEVAQREEACTRLHNALEALAHRLGKNAISTLADFYPAQGSALCIFEELDHFGRGADAGQFVGPLWCDAVDLPPPAWPAKPGPRILCYLRPTGSTLDLLFRSFVARSCSVILVSPGLAPPAATLARGLGIEVISEPVALAELVAGADAVVTHGGMGLVAMALHAGLPLLVVPANAEQMLLAQRLVKQQLALATTRLTHPETLDQRLDGLTEKPVGKPPLADYREKYHGYAPEVAVRRTCELLESLT